MRFKEARLKMAWLLCSSFSSFFFYLFFSFFLPDSSQQCAGPKLSKAQACLARGRGMDADKAVRVDDRRKLSGGGRSGAKGNGQWAPKCAIDGFKLQTRLARTERLSSAVFRRQKRSAAKDTA
jgi:hypothetical protein